MRLHFLVHFDEGFGETDLHQHKSKLGRCLGHGHRSVFLIPGSGALLGTFSACGTAAGNVPSASG